MKSSNNSIVPIVRPGRPDNGTYCTLPMNWCDPNLLRFAKAAVDSGTLYYMKGRGGHAAQAGSLPGYEAFLPLWTSHEAALSCCCGVWERFVVRPLPCDGLRYFKDDFIMNRWGAVCYFSGNQEPVETAFLSLVAAIAREQGRRRGRARPRRCPQSQQSRHVSVSQSAPINPNLAGAVERFLKRGEQIGVAGHTSPKSELCAFERRFPNLMPGWYREVLEQAQIGDICFVADVKGLPWKGAGHFRDAETLLAEIEGAHPDIDLAEAGYLVLGAAGNGDGWVIRADSTPEEPVHLLQMSSYRDGDPRDYDCLLLHGASFAEFLDQIEPTADWHG